MVQINFANKQVSAKIVYYGPGMSGKTTNLEVVHERAPASNRGDLTSISTDGDRTLFFDYMPLDLGQVAGMRTSFQIYTVPGQVYYNSTRKLVLQGVDGVIFVADSSPDKLAENLESLRNLEENLNEYGKSLATLPHVIQFNKRDLPEVMSVEELNAQLNPHGAEVFEAVASSGQGVFPTLKAAAAAVLRNIMKAGGGSKQPEAAAPAPAGVEAPPAAIPVAHAPQQAPRPAAAGVGAGQQHGGTYASAAAPAAPHRSAPAAQHPAQHAPAPRPGQAGYATQAGQHAAPQRAAQGGRPQAPPRQAPAAQPQRASAAPARGGRQASHGKRPAGKKRAVRAYEPEPEEKKRSSGGVFTIAFVVVAAVVGAILAKVILSAV